MDHHSCWWLNEKESSSLNEDGSNTRRFVERDEATGEVRMLGKEVKREEILFPSGWDAIGKMLQKKFSFEGERSEDNPSVEEKEERFMKEELESVSTLFPILPLSQPSFSSLFFLLSYTVYNLNPKTPCSQPFLSVFFVCKITTETWPQITNHFFPHSKSSIGRKIGHTFQQVDWVNPLSHHFLRNWDFSSWLVLIQ